MANPKCNAESTLVNKGNNSPQCDVLRVKSVTSNCGVLILPVMMQFRQLFPCTSHMASASNVECKITFQKDLSGM